MSGAVTPNAGSLRFLLNFSDDRRLKRAERSVYDRPRLDNYFVRRSWRNEPKLNQKKYINVSLCLTCDAGPENARGVKSSRDVVGRISGVWRLPFVLENPSSSHHPAWGLPRHRLITQTSLARASLLQRAEVLREFTSSSNSSRHHRELHTFVDYYVTVSFLISDDGFSEK